MVPERGDASLVDLDDDALIAESRTNRDAFATLYERHQPTIYNFVLGKVIDPQRAEDITSQVFLRAFQNLSRFRPGSFRGWLYQIARNAVIDSHRRERPAASSDALAWHADPDPGPLEHVEQREAREQLHRLIDQLPARQQRIVQLRLRGYTGREIAEATGMSMSAVRSAQFRAFSRLRDLMADQNDVTDSRPRASRQTGR